MSDSETQRLAERLVYAAGFMRGRVSLLHSRHDLIAVAEWLEGFAGLHSDPVMVPDLAVRDSAADWLSGHAQWSGAPQLLREIAEWLRLPIKPHEPPKRGLMPWAAKVHELEPGDAQKLACEHPNAVPSERVPALSCPDCGAVFRRQEER